MNDDFIRQADRHQIELAEINNRERRARREWWGGVLAGLAVTVGVLAAILGLAAVIIDNNRGNDEVERACTENGGSMVSLNQGATCLHINVDPQ